MLKKGGFGRVMRGSYDAKEDIMAYLLRTQGSGRKLTNEELITDTLIMTVRGSDTTNSGLVHAQYRLAKHQDIQQKIHDEVTYVCPTNEKVSIAHLNDLEYLSAFINEVLRLYPPAAQRHFPGRPSRRARHRRPFHLRRHKRHHAHVRLAAR